MADGQKPTQRINDFDALYQQAKESQPLYAAKMNEYLSQLKERYPGVFEGVQFEQGLLKTRDRALAKINGDYDGQTDKIADLVRGRFVVNTAQQADILRKDIVAHAPFKVEKLKDQFAEPLDTQFRAVNAQVRLSNGHLAEFRVEHKGMLEASLSTHKPYEEMQEIERLTTREQRHVTPQEKILLEQKLNEIGIVLDRAAVESKLDPLLNEKGRADVAAFRNRVGAGRESIAVLVPVVPHSERATSQNPVPILVSQNEHSHTPPPVVVTKPAHSTESALQPIPVVRKIGITGATAQLAIGPAFEATLSAANDGNASDIAQASLHGLANAALPGVTSGFKNITENNQHQNRLDQLLNAGTTATQGIAVSALAVAGGSAIAAPATGGASLTVTAGSMVVAGVSGIANLGIGVAHDVTYWTGLSKQGGLITGLAGMAGQLADSKAAHRAGDWVMGNDSKVQQELAATGIKPGKLTAIDDNRDGKVSAQETRDYLIKRNMGAEQINALPAKELAVKLATVLAADAQASARTTAPLKQDANLSPDMLRALSAAMGSNLATSIRCDSPQAAQMTHMPHMPARQTIAGAAACR